MATPPLIKLDLYLIDCSSIMAFSGADYANPNRFLEIREQIWAHFQGMVLSDRLKTVAQVLPELEYNDPDSYKRLYPFRDRFVVPPDNQTEFGVFNLISKYPKLIDKGQTYTREPADPYLIVYAQKLGVPIITEELPLAERKGIRKNKRRMIPDVCDLEGIEDQCICLEEFLQNEGIIPANTTSCTSFIE